MKLEKNTIISIILESITWFFTFLIILVEVGIIENTIAKWIIIIIYFIASVAKFGFIVYQIKKSKSDLYDSIFNKILDLACQEFTLDPQKPIRGVIFLEKPKDKNKIKITNVSTNRIDAPDNNIEFEKYSGCAGKAWGNGTDVIGDLRNPPSKDGLMDEWNMTEEQILLTSEIQTILAIPIKSSLSKENLGAIGFDSKFDYVEHLSDEKIITRAKAYAKVVQEIIEKREENKNNIFTKFLN